MASIHDKLERVRKPRVHITYKVETEGALVEKELPFVVGVLGDFSGKPTEPLKPLKDRKFIQIDRDNFNDVMARMTPGLNLKVENTLKNDGSEMAVQLKFNSMEDFEPGKIVKQVDPLNKLLETRDKLRDLLTKVDRSEDLEGLSFSPQGFTFTAKVGDPPAPARFTVRSIGGEVTGQGRVEGAEQAVLPRPGSAPLQGDQRDRYFGKSRLGPSPARLVVNVTRA